MGIISWFINQQTSLGAPFSNVLHKLPGICLRRGTTHVDDLTCNDVPVNSIFYPSNSQGTPKDIMLKL